jgi:hypothetical protein
MVRIASLRQASAVTTKTNRQGPMRYDARFSAARQANFDEPSHASGGANSSASRYGIRQ